jgi:hypothetical protein
VTSEKESVTPKEKQMEQSVFYGNRMGDEKRLDVCRRRDLTASRTEPLARTLLDLVQAVQEQTSSDEEVVAVISRLLRTRQVVLCGTFAGCPLSRLAA